MAFHLLFAMTIAGLLMLRISFVKFIKNKVANFQNSGNLYLLNTINPQMKAITLNPSEKESPRLERITLFAAGMTVITTIYLLVTNLV